jgi:hypothetical protein
VVFGGTGGLTPYHECRIKVAIRPAVTILGFHVGGIIVAMSPIEYGSAASIVNAEKKATPIRCQLKLFMVQRV